jgi:hypothetical protein
MGEKLGQEVTDDDFDTDVELTVNVGMGATDPMMRLNKLLAGARAFAEIGQLQAQGGGNLNVEELGKEVFAAMGYRDGGRFIQEGEDPRIQQIMLEAQAAIQDLQQQLAEANEKQQAVMMQLEIKREQAIQEGQIDAAMAQAEYEREVAQMNHEFMLERERLNAEIAAENRRIAQEFAVAMKRVEVQGEAAKIAAKNKPKQKKAA